MRSGKVKKQPVLPDAIYLSPLVAKLINKVMKSGKKSIAQKAVYLAMESIRQKNGDPVKTFEKAIDNISPKMEVKARRVGGASYLVPVEVRGNRRQSLALSWLVAAARKRSVKDLSRPKNQPPIAAKLATEILDAASGTGNAIAKKEEVNRIAEANKAFAQFRW